MNTRQPSLKDQLTAEAIALSAYYDRLVEEGFPTETARELTMRRASSLPYD